MALAITKAGDGEPLVGAFLASAWTVADATAPTCGGAAPADAASAGWDASDTSYASEWAYSPGGRITSLSERTNDPPAMTKDYGYSATGHPAEVTSVINTGTTSTPFTDTVSDDFSSGAYAGGTGARWSGVWTETDDDGSATDTAGLVLVADGMLKVRGSQVSGAVPGVVRTVDVSDANTAEVNLGVLSGAVALDAGDVLTVQVIADGDPSRVTTLDLLGDSNYPAVVDTANPPSAVAESLDVSDLLPATSLKVSVFVDAGDGVSNTTGTGDVFLIQDVTMDVSGSITASETVSDGFVFDDAGRMTGRTVDEVTTELMWDPKSNLVESDGAGGHVVYAYDTGGQRVAQVTLAKGSSLGTATGYVGSGEVTDPNTATSSTGDLTATRFYTFAGATVAVRTDDGQLSLMLGDEQGSTSVMMPVTIQPGGQLQAATLADASASTRTSYTPYGQLRGADNEDINRGWLGQVEDTGTGLTYLNARYYDPVLSRFLSPDPLMDPGDPRTLDPYLYSSNNPVVFTDASGLMPCGSWLDRFGMGFIGGSCGSPDGAIHAGAGASGVAAGGEAYMQDQLRVFTPQGARQLTGDIATHGSRAPAYWAAQSVLNSGQHLANATESAVGAVRYDNPAMTRNAAADATPLVLDGARNYVSIMYAGAGASFSGLGPTASATQWTTSRTSLSRFAARSRTANADSNTVVIGRDMENWVKPMATLYDAGYYTGTPGWVRNALSGLPPLRTKVDLAFNKGWIRAQMAANKTIIDVGQRNVSVKLPVSRFYSMEIHQTRNYSGSVRYK